VEGLAASVVLIAILLGVLLVVVFDVFCLLHLGKADTAPFLPKFAWAVPVLLVGVPRDLEKMAIGIGEVPGVDAEGAHMSGGGQRASSGFDLPEQLVDLCL